jgi:hypothetical protein
VAVLLDRIEEADELAQIRQVSDFFLLISGYAAFLTFYIGGASELTLSRERPPQAGQTSAWP